MVSKDPRPTNNRGQGINKTKANQGSTRTTGIKARSAATKTMSRLEKENNGIESLYDMPSSPRKPATAASHTNDKQTSKLPRKQVQAPPDSNQRKRRSPVSYGSTRKRRWTAASNQIGKTAEPIQRSKLELSKVRQDADPAKTEVPKKPKPLFSARSNKSVDIDDRSAAPSELLSDPISDDIGEGFQISKHNTTTRAESKLVAASRESRKSTHPEPLYEQVAKEPNLIAKLETQSVIPDHLQLDFQDTSDDSVQDENCDTKLTRVNDPITPLDTTGLHPAATEKVEEASKSDSTTLYDLNNSALIACDQANDDRLLEALKPRKVQVLKPPNSHIDASAACISRKRSLVSDTGSPIDTRSRFEATPLGQDIIAVPTYRAVKVARMTGPEPLTASADSNYLPMPLRKYANKSVPMTDAPKMVLDKPLTTHTARYANSVMHEPSGFIRDVPATARNEKLGAVTSNPKQPPVHIQRATVDFMRKVASVDKALTSTHEQQLQHGLSRNSSPSGLEYMQPEATNILHKPNRQLPPYTCETPRSQELGRIDHRPEPRADPIGRWRECQSAVNEASDDLVGSLHEVTVVSLLRQVHRKNYLTRVEFASSPRFKGKSNHKCC